jgi:hypothetical protein
VWDGQGGFGSAMSRAGSWHVGNEQAMEAGDSSLEGGPRASTSAGEGERRDGHTRTILSKSIICPCSLPGNTMVRAPGSVTHRMDCSLPQTGPCCHPPCRLQQTGPDICPFNTCSRPSRIHGIQEQNSTQREQQEQRLDTTGKAATGSQAAQSRRYLGTGNASPLPGSGLRLPPQACNHLRDGWLTS